MPTNRLPAKKPGAPKIAAPGANPVAKIDPLKDVRDFYAKNGHVPTELANESQRRFGTKGDAKLYGDLGTQVARGKMTKAQALERIRNGEGVPEINRRAGDAVSVELDPQISQVNRRAEAETTQANQTIEANNKDTARYTGSVQTLYDTLAKQMAGNNQLSQAGWQQAQTGTKTAYDDLIAATGKTYDRVNTDASNFANSLGIQAALPEATAQTTSDKAFLTSLFAGQSQGKQDLLNLFSKSDNAYGNNMINANLSRGAQFQAQAHEENLRGNTELRQTADRNSLEYRGQAGDLESVRGAKLRENIASLEDSRAQARSEAEAARWDREIAVAKLELQREELGVNANYKQGQLDIDRAKLGIDQQRVQIEARKTDAQLKKELRELQPGTLEYEEKVAAIDLKKSQTKKNIYDITKPPKADPKKHGKGRVGAESYLESLGDPTLVQAGMHEVTLAMQYGKDYPSAVAFMRKNFGKFSELKDPNVQRALLTALDLAWEGPKTPAKKK